MPLKKASKGLLISFDGIDSSGKETQTEKLARRLRFQGQVVHVLQSPDYSIPSGQKLQRLLHSTRGEWEKLSWQEKMQLFALNRVEHRERVMQALKRHEIIIYDRYVPSSIAFITAEALLKDKSTERQQIGTTVAHHEYEENSMPREDISIFLDVPPKLTQTLLKRRKRKRKEGQEYTDLVAIQERLYKEYDLLCTDNPQHYIRIACVEGTEILGTEDIAELVWEALITRFPLLEKKSG